MKTSLRIEAAPAILATTAALALLLIALIHPGSGRAGEPHRFYADASRAVPTQSGEFVKITIFTTGWTSAKIAVNDGPFRTASRAGKACSGGTCDKWRLYVPRTRRECYDLMVQLDHRGARMKTMHVVCEPFRVGTLR